MTILTPPRSDTQVLDVLCPLHLQISAGGRILHLGPTLRKLRPEKNLLGRQFLEVFDLQRPRHLKTMADLLAAGQSKLHLRLKGEPQTALQGVLVADPFGDGALINLSFGISLIKAVRDYDLTSSDFAGTDLAVEMLFLIEAKTAVLDESRKLNERLQVAKTHAEKQAFTDPLTGIKNRRAVEHALEELLAVCGPFCFLQLDLDFFKAVNDTHGHAAGDLVLQKVAEILLEETREQDDVARIGGDEFVVIMRGAVPRSRLERVAQRLITRLQEPIYFEDNPCCISASIGISVLTGREGICADILMQQTDRALYASKANGRSQFAFSDTQMG